jgi:hypothetical protein
MSLTRAAGGIDERLSPLQTMVATVPPSTDQCAPVTSAARSLQRKTTTPAISS